VREGAVGVEAARFPMLLGEELGAFMMMMMMMMMMMILLLLLVISIITIISISIIVIIIITIIIIIIIEYPEELGLQREGECVRERLASRRLVFRCYWVRNSVRAG
jgi:CBS domain containing-hemolysin-like protein